jgi:hypothetical protein
MINGIDTEKEENNKLYNELNSVWVLWYASRKEEHHHIKYCDRLKSVGEINSLYSFFSYYVYTKSVDNIDKHNDIALFKKGYNPTWESCPNSACWFIRFKKTDDPVEIDLIWEKILFCLVGEQFEEPHLLGAVLSIRGRETIIELWFNFFKDDVRKFSIANKMANLTNLDSTFLLYFKDNELSVKDNSTIRNAESYCLSK